MFLRKECFSVALSFYCGHAVFPGEVCTSCEEQIPMGLTFCQLKDGRTAEGGVFGEPGVDRGLWTSGFG